MLAAPATGEADCLDQQARRTRSTPKYQGAVRAPSASALECADPRRPTRSGISQSQCCHSSSNATWAPDRKFIRVRTAKRNKNSASLWSKTSVRAPMSPPLRDVPNPSPAAAAMHSTSADRTKSRPPHRAPMFAQRWQADGPMRLLMGAGHGMKSRRRGSSTANVQPASRRPAR